MGREFGGDRDGGTCADHQFCCDGICSDVRSSADHAGGVSRTRTRITLVFRCFGRVLLAGDLLVTCTRSHALVVSGPRTRDHKGSNRTDRPVRINLEAVSKLSAVEPRAIFVQFKARGAGLAGCQ